MAYQVISQNNTTTTLADENGNVIRVPARVSLATSTDYTIKKVNNSTATLEDGNGNIIRDVPCVAVLVGGEGGGGGGSDPHNLGWYADLTALQTAHPTAEDGDFAILGSTDTVWVWDSDTTAWKDTDTKGQVTSVNGQTGAVTVDTLPSQTGNAGKFLTTDGTDASWSDKPLVNTATGENSLTIFGTPTTTVRALNIGYNCSATTNAPNATAVGYNCIADGNSALAIGTSAKATGGSSIAINGQTNMANQSSNAVAIGSKVSGNKTIAIMTGSTNYYTNITASYATVLGYIANPNTIESNSFYVGIGINANQTCKLLSSDGTIPADRLVHAINKYSSMPTASSTNEGWIVQFTGTTDSTYTHGYIYECVSDGGNPATYSWSAINVQAGSSGGLQNTATGTDSLTILGTATAKSSSINIGYNSRAGGEYSSTCLAVGNNSLSTGNYSVALGIASEATGSGAISLGYVAKANGEYSLAIGELATVSANNAIQINAALAARTNSDANTFKVGNANGNYEIMDANGNLPSDRLASTTGLADGNYRLRLTMASGVPTLSWVAE